MACVLIVTQWSHAKMCMQVEFRQTNIFWSFDKYKFEQIVLVGKRNPTNRQTRKLVVTQRDHFRMCRQVDCRRRRAQPRIGSSGPLLTPCYVQSTIQSGAPGVLELLLLLIVAQVVAFGAQSKVAPLVEALYSLLIKISNPTSFFLRFKSLPLLPTNKINSLSELPKSFASSLDALVWLFSGLRHVLGVHQFYNLWIKIHILCIFLSLFMYFWGLPIMFYLLSLFAPCTPSFSCSTSLKTLCQNAFIRS